MKQLILILLLTSLYAGGISIESNYDYTAQQETATEVQPENNEVSTQNAGVYHLTDENYYDTIGSTQGVVLVDFWAEWCGPCMSLGPILEEISQEENIIVYKVNVDECPQISSDFSITGIPMVYVYKDGVIVDSILGLSDKSTYVDLIDSYNDK